VTVISIVLAPILACDDSPTASATADTIVLANGLLIDGTGAEPLEDATVVVQGTRIIQIGQDAAVYIPEDAVLVDLEGATILPGFFNTHVHNGFVESNLRAWARGGVTSVRDIGADPRLNHEFAVTPRVRAAECAELLTGFFASRR